MVGFREDSQRTACQRGSALTLCARLRRMLFVPLDRTGWRAAGEGRSGQEATFCSYGVSAGGAGRKQHFVLRCLQKRPNALVRWKPGRLQKRPKALVRWKRPCALLYDGSLRDQMPVYDGKGFALRSP